MSEEKAIYRAGLIIAAVSIIGFVGIIGTLQQRVKSLEKVVNTLPERLVLALKKSAGF